MLSQKIIAKNSTIEGSGLFAIEDIEEGEFIWKSDHNEEIWPIEVVEKWSPEKQERFYRYAYQVDSDHYAGYESGVSEDEGDLMNHSCDPNTWFVDDGTMVARRPIKAGEEITYDYATSEVSELFSLECLCGSENCRELIKGDDILKSEELQKRYGSHMMEHVKALLSS